MGFMSIVASRRLINSYSIVIGKIVLIDVLAALMFLKMNPSTYVNSIVVLIYLSGFASLLIGYYIGLKCNFKFVNTPFIGINHSFLSLNKARFHVGLIASLFFIVVYLFFFAHHHGLDLFTRSFYEKTRIGYGIWLYPCMLFLNCLFLVVLLDKPNYVSLIYLISIMILISAFGSKGLVLNLFIYIIVILNFHYKAHFLLTLIVFFLTFFSLAALLCIYNPNLFSSKFWVYQDQVRNLSFLIDSGYSFNGKVLFDNTIYSSVPRSLFPAKPISYGMIYVNQVLFGIDPSVQQGVKSFGSFSSIYADFRMYSLIMIVPLYFFKGIFLSYLEKLMIKNRSCSMTVCLTFLALVGSSAIHVNSFEVIPFSAAVGFVIDLFFGRVKLYSAPNDPMAGKKRFLFF